MSSAMRTGYTTPYYLKVNVSRLQIFSDTDADIIAYTQ